MKDSTYAAGGLGKKRDIKLAKDLIKALQGVDTSGAMEMKEFLNKEILSGGYKPVKKIYNKEDGGLIGGQKKLDKNKDGKISGEDFKLLRAKPMKSGGVVEMGSGGGVCKGMGIARAGGKFKVR
jgi:hypothetical protein